MREPKEGEEIASGMISASEVKETTKWIKTSFLISGLWYGSFNQDLQTFKDGTNVQFLWKWDPTRKYRNIVDNCMEKFMNVDDAGPTKQEVTDALNKTFIDHRELKIIRQCCLKAAVELVGEASGGNMTNEVKIVLAVAEQMEEWVHR